MAKANRDGVAKQQDSDKKPIALRLDPATRAALEAEAEQAAMKLGTYCRTVLERHVSGQSLELLANQLAELVQVQERQNQRLDQLSLGSFETLRTLLLNLTDIKEDDLKVLRQRVLGR